MIYLHWNGLKYFALGISFCLEKGRKNFEIHFPGGFLRLGQIKDQIKFFDFYNSAKALHNGDYYE